MVLSVAAYVCLFAALMVVLSVATYFSLLVVLTSLLATLLVVVSAVADLPALFLHLRSVLSLQISRLRLLHILLALFGGDFHGLGIGHVW